MHFGQGYDRNEARGVDLSSGHFDRLVEVVSARFIYCKITIFSLQLINNLWRNTDIPIILLPSSDSILRILTHVNDDSDDCKFVT